MSFTDDAHHINEIRKKGADIAQILKKAGVKPDSLLLMALLWLVVGQSDAGTDEQSEKTIRDALDTFLDVDRAISQAFPDLREEDEDA